MLLVLSGAAFLAWLGWLAYLAATASRPIVLSRPQFLVAELVVIADLPDENGPAVIQEICWPPHADGLKPGDRIEVPNLPASRGFRGPGRYILPLAAVHEGKTYAVVPTPHSPGYPPPDLGMPLQAGPPRIYPDTAETRSQLRQIRRITP